MRNQDKFRGCLIGGAAGDALGYAVEFYGEWQIFQKYGRGGITEYSLRDGMALFSDDTQMTLFTAAGLLACAARAGMEAGVADFAGTVNGAYLDWLDTQEKRYPLQDAPRASWLVNVPQLFRRRAPGTTCLSALYAGGSGTPEKPINESKGCGGVMRVAPVGLFFNDSGRDIADVCRLGACAAALTHGHPLGWMPAGALAQIVHEVSQDGADLSAAVAHTLDATIRIWPESRDRDFFVSLIEKAADLANGSKADLDAVHLLGEGWVGEEALAIAVYCALRHEGDFDATLIAAVNHKGDSDSTGAIAGNIAGAQAGLSGIPAKYTENLELRDLILEIADDLWRGRADGRVDVWKQKYVDFTYKHPAFTAE